MFVGASKNIGGGFRIGVGTRLGSKKKGMTAEQKKDKEFMEFLRTAQKDMNVVLVTFVEANGQDFKQLMKSKADLDEVFADNEDYPEFKKTFDDAKLKIDKILYSGDTGVTAKRQITNGVFELKNFIDTKYPNFKPKYKVGSTGGFFGFVKRVVYGVIFFIVVLIIMGVIVSPSKDKTTTQAPAQEVVK